MERANLISYRLNEGNKTRRRRNSNKIRRDMNNNQENYFSEESYTTRRKLCGYGSTTTGGTVSILLSGI